MRRAMQSEPAERNYIAAAAQAAADWVSGWAAKAEPLTGGTTALPLVPQEDAARQTPEQDAKDKAGRAGKKQLFAPRDFIEVTPPTTPKGTPKKSSGKAKKKMESDRRGKRTPNSDANSRRTKLMSPGMQIAMAKAKTEADARQASAKLAADAAAAEAAKAKADAEAYQRSIAAYLASDLTPAALAAKDVMESTYCAPPLPNRWRAVAFAELRVRCREKLLLRPLLLLTTSCYAIVRRGAPRNTRLLGKRYGTRHYGVVHANNAPTAGGCRREGRGRHLRIGGHRDSL